MAQTAYEAGRISRSQPLASGRESTKSPRAGARNPDFTRIRWVVQWLRVSIFVVVVGGAFLSSVQEYREHYNEAQKDAAVVARAIEPYLGSVIDRANRYLVEQRRMVEAMGGPESFSEGEFGALTLNRPKDDIALRFVVLSQADGRTVAVAGGKRDAIPSVADREFFQAHKANRSREPLVSAPFRSRIDGRWRLPVSVRLDDPRTGEFAGVLNTSVEIELLSRYFVSVGLANDAIIHLVTTRGETLARHPVPQTAPNPARIARIVDTFIDPGGVFRMESPVTGDDHIGAYRKLGDLPIYAVVSFRAHSVFANWGSNTAIRVVAGVAGLLVTTLLAALVLRHLGAEQVATANLAKFRRAVDLSGDLIYWVDFQGNIVYLNDAAARRMGGDPRSLIGKLHVRDLTAQYSEGQWDSLRKQLSTAGESTFQSVHRTKDGSAYPVQVSATHVAVDGQDLGFLICRDLSQQVRQQQAIRDLNASLEQRVEERTRELADANAEMESFAYSVSHDLRAPLNHLSAYAESLVESDPADHFEQRRLANKIRERSEYMTDLIDALLTLSRVGRTQLDRRNVDLGDIAEEIDAEHRRLEPTRNVLTRIEPGMQIDADRVLLRTLLENLIGNAWKYTSKVPTARIEVFTEIVDGTRAFVVRDNGAGFDPRYAARLFSPFARLHNQSEFKGNGVGLATARRIVSRHGGRIWAESTPGQGATFRFTLN